MTVPSILPTLLIQEPIWRERKIKNTTTKQNKAPQTVQSDTVNCCKDLLLRTAELRNIDKNLENSIVKRYQPKSSLLIS